MLAQQPCLKGLDRVLGSSCDGICLSASHADGTSLGYCFDTPAEVEEPYRLS